MRTVFFLIIILAIISCKSKSPDENTLKPFQEIVINPANKETIKRSQIMQLVEIIYLDNEEYQIGEIYSVYPYGDFFLINSLSASKFTANGEFRSQIGKKGKGPGEYMFIADILWNSGHIYLLDRTQQKIATYSEDGKHMYDKRIGVFGQAITYYDDHFYVYVGNELNKYNKRLLIYDSQFRLKDSFFETDPDRSKFINFFDKNNFLNYSDSLRFFFSFDNYIYNVSHNKSGFEIHPRYFINFNKYNLPNEYFDKKYSDAREFFISLQKTNYAFRIMGFHETDDLIMFMFWHGSTPLLAFYSKVNNEAIVIDKMIDDILFVDKEINLVDEYFAYFFSENHIYFVIYPYQILDYTKTIEKSQFPNKTFKPEIIELFRKIDINDNPVILKFQINNIV